MTTKSSTQTIHGNPKQVWEDCLKIIKDNVNWRSFNTWFEPIVPVSVEDNVLTIQVPSSFFYEWLEEHYVELIGKTIRRVLGKGSRLEYLVQVEKSKAGAEPATMQLPGSSHARKGSEGNMVDMDYLIQDPNQIKNPFTIPGMRRIQINPQLNENLTFENYVEGESNRLARRSGLNVASKPGATSFNPLMVFGPTSCGKTHLLQAIGNEIRQKHPSKSVLYVSAEKFINQFIDHSRNHEVNDFIHFYQMLDVLLLDDIHFFVSAPKTQDVFFAIFNHLRQNGKQIVLTSDTMPNRLEGMEERLISRFRWGLTAQIDIPDFETRKAILKMKMHNEGLEIDDEIISYIAFNVKNNIRDLEGTVISLYAHATLTRREVDLDLAKEVLKSFIENVSKELNTELIQKMVSEFCGITTDQMLSRSRKQEIVQARQIAMFLAKEFTNDSYKSIGKYFSGKDHSTVMHSCKAVQDRLDTDEDYKKKFLEIQHKVKLASI